MWPNPEFPADLVSFTEEILNGKLHFLCSDGRFDHSSWAYEIAKFWMIKLCLNVSDAITFKNFWKFWLKSFCSLMRKDHFKKKLLIWLQVLFNEKRDFT